jgi:ATP-binding cassette subfamily F protein 3
MIILNCSNISKSYGIVNILQDISFNVQENDKIGLVGVNGAGKSTLFKVMTGEITPDSGEIYKAKDLKIGYMAQNCIIDSPKNIWDELLEVFSPLIEMEMKIKNLEKQIQTETDTKRLDVLVREHGDLCEKFREKNGYGYTSHIRAVLIGLGFQDDQFSLPIQNLSGGQKTRVAFRQKLMFLLKKNI